MVILKVGYFRARGDFGCRFPCGGNELSRHGLGCGGGGVRSALFHLAAVHAHADIVLTVDLDRSNVDDEVRGHRRMSFTGVDLGVFYQKTVPLSRGDSGLLHENSMIVAKRTKSPRAKSSETPSHEEEEKSLEQLLAELRVAQRNDFDWDRLAAYRADRRR